MTHPSAVNANERRSIAKPMHVMIVTPSLDTGAADAGAVELTRALTTAGHRATVVSRAGRMVADVTIAGGRFVPLDVATANPFRILRNAIALLRLARETDCDCIHALGRSGAWSAFCAARMRGCAFITSWYKGFREQNLFKRLYNSVMASGDRIVAVSEQIAQLIVDRYHTPWSKIAIVPCSVDLARFDPDRITAERIEAIRRTWGVGPDTKVIVVVGRILRRKGHDVVVKAVERLKARGVNDLLCVFVGEDRGATRYTGELWDQALATGTMDAIRMAAPVHDMAAAYAAATVVVSAAVQPEGAQRGLLEAQAMRRPVIVSDLAAGSDVVLTAPAVPETRVAGLRFPAGDDEALATALLRIFAMPPASREAMGARGRDWVVRHFHPAVGAERILNLYSEAAGRPQSTDRRAAA